MSNSIQVTEENACRFQKMSLSRAKRFANSLFGDSCTDELVRVFRNVCGLNNLDSVIEDINVIHEGYKIEDNDVIHFLKEQL